MERKCIVNLAMLRPVIVLVLRLVLGVVFIIAAYGKLLHPDVLVSTVINFDILPMGLAKLFAYVLPWIEIISGAMLIVGFGIRGASLSLGLLLVSFIIAVAVNMHRGVSMECGCFDIFGMNEKIGSAILIRDTIFLVVTVVFLFTKKFMLSIDGRMKKK
ncbi:MAG: DoxX family membrane protein [Deltaproteobacteria bacterium]|nr:DoxX family membrane protein [Deltaproteobacteria bacterium]MCL5277595.1 DoxX family membrane protein [Deltaproteobacteria bacterium]